MRCIQFIVIFTLLSIPALACAGDLSVQLPKEMKPTTASATASEPEVSTNGEIKDQTIAFRDLLADTPYDVKIALDDGTVLQGVDLSWYTEDPPKHNAGEFSDDDRKEVQAIMDVKSFYNKSNILLLNGDHDRATVLVERIRDNGFHSGGEGDVIWRVELWYFKNEYGGWAEINQVNKILRREHFHSHAEYEKATSKLKWTSALGGIVVPKDQSVTVKLPSPAAASTQPSTRDAGN